MKFEVVTVTPDMARQWLATNSSGNRKVSDSDVATLAHDMRRGKYELTHQGIAFDENGTLIDGQHRLRAIILANVSVKLVVVRGVPCDIKSNIDQGRRRSVAFLAGLSNSVIGVYNALIYLENGAHHSVGRRASKDQILEVASHYDNLSNAFLPLVKRRVMTGGTIGGLLFAAPLNEESVLLFAESVRDGENLQIGQPAHTLRRWLLEYKGVHSAHACALSACAAVAHHLQGKEYTSVYPAATTGFRWLCTKRRAAKIPHTPDADRVAPDAGGGAMVIEPRPLNGNRLISGSR